MKKYSDPNSSFDTLREKIVGLGEYSIKKSYFPELQKRISELEHSESKNKALITAIPDALILFDASGTIVDYSPGRSIKLQYNGDNIVGANIRNVKPRWISKLFFDNADDIIRKKTIKELEYTINHGRNKAYYEIRGVACGKREVLFILRDITVRKNLENKLTYIGTIDFLTGLYNRSYFERVQQDILRDSKNRIGMIICDIDGLKLINDTLGHSAGDMYLKQAANIIKECSPKDSIVARIGGDEFGILVFNADEKLLEGICLKINSRVNEFNLNNSGTYLSISTGMAQADTFVQDDFERLFAQADNDMYRKKLLQSKSTKNAIVKTLMKAMEARDFITEGHAIRLEKIAFIMAKKLGFSESKTNDLRLLAKFHDIGKVGIPDSILQKPARLTPEEKKVMQMHSLIGQRIASASPELIPIADLILKHHENWDGTGYPLGIKADNIPIECRILSLADAFDAMTNDRPYRKAMSEDMAIEEIRICKGTQFDPELAQLFIELVQAKAFSNY
jgi:diguanylate cyclase (GGDEF)-like protein